MTLSSGARLGPYEILAPLGAGGMGEGTRDGEKPRGGDGQGQDIGTAGTYGEELARIALYLASGIR